LNDAHQVLSQGHVTFTRVQALFTHGRPLQIELSNSPSQHLVDDLFVKTSRRIHPVPILHQKLIYN